jgi:hypothetical protein
VDCGAIEWVLPVSDAEESSRLLERLSANARDFGELGAGAKPSMLVSVGDDVERGALGDASYVSQESPRRGVKVDAYAVYAALDDSFERLLKLALVDVVLILTDPNGFGIDLDELGEGVLETAGDGDGSPDGKVEVRKLLAGDIGCGVDAGSGLGDRNGKKIVEQLALAKEVADEGVGLARCGAVADCNGADVVF